MPGSSSGCERQGYVRALRASCAATLLFWSGKLLNWSRSDPAGLTLHCIPRHNFGVRVIPDASAPVIDPRTKPASLPERRNEFGVRHFSPHSRATRLGASLDDLVQQWALALSALDLCRLGITRGSWRFGFGKTLFLQRLVRPTSLTGRLSFRTSGARCRAGCAVKGRPARAMCLPPNMTTVELRSLRR